MRKIDSKAFKKAMIDADCDTYDKLYKRTGINRNALSDYVMGNQKPSYDSMVKLADELNLTYEEIGTIFFHIDLQD